MSRAYITVTQAQAAYYADRAVEYARRGLPGLASDYRWLADHTNRIVQAARPQQSERTER